MQIVLQKEGDEAKIPEWGLLEFQGNFESRESHMGVHGQYLGDLNYTKEGVPFFIIGHHILYGQEVKLHKPMAMMRRSENGYNVTAVIRKKCMFINEWGSDWGVVDRSHVAIATAVFGAGGEGGTITARVHRPATMLGQSLVQQKRMQWAKEREEMMGLCGLWNQAPLKSAESRRSSLLPPIQSNKHDVAEESETSGYTSDSPLHDNTKAHKQEQNEWRAQRSLCDSTPDTPDDRPKWGDRGVGVGHLWEPVPELPDARLPQVLESYRSTPRWVERGLGLSDGTKAEILEIHHDEEPPQSKFLLGQNVPLPPEVLEERERKRKRALEHQNAIRKQLDERERKRKEEKEARLREERLEEQRILKEREWERRRQEEESELQKRKRRQEEIEEAKMKEAINNAEKRAKEDRERLKRRELERVNDVISITSRSTVSVASFASKSSKDFACQADAKDTKDASSQCDGGLALVLDGGPGLALLMPQPRVVTHATTQTRRETPTYSSRSDVSDKSLSGAYNSCVSFGKVRSARPQQQNSTRDRPKWGINRPTVQYRKQSEKDPHYSRRARRRARRLKETAIQLRCEHRLLPANTDDDFDEKGQLESSVSITPEKDQNCSEHPVTTENREETLSNESEDTQVTPPEEEAEFRTHPSDFALENGFRMNSGESSPRFIPIQRRTVEDLETETCKLLADKVDFDGAAERVAWMNEEQKEEDVVLNDIDDDDDSVCVQPEIIARIAALKLSLSRLNDENESARTSPSSSLLSLESAPTPK